MTALRRGPTRRARPRAALLAAGLALAIAPRAGAQERAVILPEPNGTAVGVVVMLEAGGPGSDQPDGAAYLAGAAVAERLRPRLDALGAELRLTCDRSALRYTLLSPPATWWVATDLLLEFIFHQDPGDRAIASARAALVQRLRSQEANPDRLAERALEEATFDGPRPWTRARCGRSETVRALAYEDVRRTRRAHFDPARAAAAVAGPVDEQRAHRLLADALADVRRAVHAPDPAPGPTGGRRTLRRNTVTSWTGVAFPLPDDADRDAVRLLAFHLREQFAPAPVRPAIVGIETRIDDTRGTALLVLRLVTDPDAAQRWTDALLERVRRLGERPLSGAAFAALVRRYRGDLLLRLAGPEDRAHEAAAQAFHDHAYDDPVRALESVTAERVRRATAALGDPAIARLGPG